MPRAGELDERITIQRASKTQNSFGEDVLSWASLGTFWAKVEPLEGRELDTAQQKWAESRFKVTMRFQPGITFTESDRITWGTRTIDVLSVEHTGRRRDWWLRLYCREVV